MKFIFAPFSIIIGLIAGTIGKKAFEQVWGLVSGEEPPDAKHRDVGSYAKLVSALLVEGALFRVSKGLVDHGLRQLFYRGSGTWPGEERPEKE